MAKSKRKKRGIDTADYGSTDIELIDWINGKVGKGKEAFVGNATGKVKKVSGFAAGNCVEGQGSKEVGLSSCSGDNTSRELHIAHITRADKKALGIVEESNDKLEDELEDKDLEDSISKTLGDEDTVEEVKMNDVGKQDLKNNRSTNLGIKFDLWNKKAVGERVKIEEEDVKRVEKSWGFGLVGYIAGMNPGKAAIFSCCNSWKVKYKVFFHGSGWIIFKFENEADRDKVLDKGPYRVYGKLLLLKVLRDLFAFNEDEISKVPVWVKFPNLPIGLWNKSALGKIASNLGKPIQSDNLTQTMQALSYARLLVEVDIAKEARYEIEIDLPNGDSMVQKVVYEFLPRFCSMCKCIGHATNVCRGKIGVKRKKVEKTSLKVDSAEAIQACTPSGRVVHKAAPTVRPACPAPSRPASPDPSRPASPTLPRSASPLPPRAASPSLQQLIPLYSLPNVSSLLPDIIEPAAKAQVQRPLFHYPPIFTECAAMAAPPETSPIAAPTSTLEGKECEKVKERRRKKREKSKNMRFWTEGRIHKDSPDEPYLGGENQVEAALSVLNYVYVGEHEVELLLGLI